MSDTRATIQDIRKKIEREKQLINGAKAMRGRTDNEGVLSRLDNQIRDGQRNLQFFEEKLRTIEMKTTSDGFRDMSIRNAGDSGRPPPPPPKDSRGDWGNAAPGSGYFPPSGPGASTTPKNRAHFTKLGKYRGIAARAEIKTSFNAL